MASQRKLHPHFLEGVRHVVSVRLQFDYPPAAAVPHSIINGDKQVLASSVETDYTFPRAEKFKAFLAHLSAFVAVTASTAAPTATAAPAKSEGKEESEESGKGVGFGVLD